MITWLARQLESKGPLRLVQVVLAPPASLSRIWLLQNWPLGSWVQLERKTVFSSLGATAV